MSRTTANSARERAARAARRLRGALSVALVLGAVALMALWLLGTGHHRFGAVGVDLLGSSALHGHPLLARISGSVVLLALVYGLWRLRRLTGCFAAGDFFGEIPILHLRAFALSLLAAALLDVLLPILLQFGAHLAGASGAGAMNLRLDGSDVWLLLVAGLFYVIARILLEARRAVEDSEQIV